MKAMNINLPSFGGFYESLWLSSDSVYDELYEIENNYGCEIKHKSDWEVSDNYFTAVGEQYTEIILSYLQEMDLRVELHFNNLWSPREYNFHTDKIYATLAWNEDYNFAGHLIALMEHHKEQLSKLIKRYHSSCDGFISFMDNTYQEWYDRIAALDCRSGDIELYVGCLLAYLIMCKQGIDHLYDLDYIIYEFADVYVGQYIEPQTEQAKQEYNQILELQAA